MNQQKWYFLLWFYLLEIKIAIDCYENNRNIWYTKDIGSFVLTYLFDSDLNQENFNDFWMKWLAKNGLKILQWEESFLLCKKDLESFFVFEYIKLSYTIVELWMIVPLQKRGYSSLYVYAFMG